ncbi:hypothetical protein [Phytoactinopolyspora halotolerans]|uniref:Uncharacterized protein n=1 Tax=Phytoactinopolyspora halotolerans TaxID=1981512 RepID=A0A6L9S1N8_9ACTN|nr:hypothetical protein [Phytoactinopolyspora halotolerans]NED98926.1 hypothetical protein [Phytoactinopolyspora halotolerans]
MPQRRATGRPRSMAWRLPAILISGLFMIVTAGLPSLASGAPVREPSVETKHETVGGPASTAGTPAPELVVVAPAGTELGVAPPPPARTVVPPLMRVGSGGTGDADHLLRGRQGHDTANPDRAPPVTGQQ